MLRYRIGRSSVALTGLAILVLGGASVRGLRADELDDWPGFRGTRVDGVSSETSVFSAEGTRLEVAWKRPLGSGYSGVSVSGGLLVTAFSDGKSDVVVALHATDGRELWRYTLDETYKGHDGSHDGPISTPLIAGGRVFALGPRGKLVALDAANGKELWKTDLVAEHGAIKPGYGFATSPLLVKGGGGRPEADSSVLIVQVGAKDAMVCGFDPRTGQRKWAAGNDAVSYQSPVPIYLHDRALVVAAGDKKVLALDPKSGDVVWEYAHEGEGEQGAVCLVPVAVDSTRIFLKHKDDRSTMLQVADRDGRTEINAVWEERSIGKSYAVAVHHDGYLYGYRGRTLACVNASTGKGAWRSREPGDGFPIVVDDHLVIITKSGGVHVARTSPEGYEEIARLKVFDDLCWTPPSFGGGSIFVRSLGEIARINVRPGTPPVLAQRERDSHIAGTRFASFLDRLGAADDKPAEIDRFLASVDSFPIIESDGRVVFVYRGPGEDLALAGDLLGIGGDRLMTRVEGTDLYYYAARLEPDARISYAFLRDFKAVVDPFNPRKTTAMFFDEEMNLSFGTASTEISWMAMPKWVPPTHLAEMSESQIGRIESHTFKSASLDAEISIDVYTPVGYENGTAALPVAYFHGGKLTHGPLRLVETLDNLIGRRMAPVIGVFINHQPPFIGADQYAKMAAEELPAFIDGKYRTVTSPDARAHIACGMGGYAAIYTVLAHPDMANKLGVQTPFMIDVAPIEPVMKSATETPLRIYLDWSTYGLRSPLDGWSMVKMGRDLDAYFRKHGYRPLGGEAHDGSGVSSWQNRTDDLLESLFPKQGT